MCEKIYVVTKGIYSDYHIITATTDYELAKKIKEKFTDGDRDWDEARIEEFSNSELVLKPCWAVYFLESGDIKNVCSAEMDYYADELNEVFEGQRFLYVHVAADTEEEAIKIAAEQRAMYLAQKNGL